MCMGSQWESVAGKHVGQRMGARAGEGWPHIEQCRLSQGVQSDPRGSSTPLAAREPPPPRTKQES